MIPGDESKSRADLKSILGYPDIIFEMALTRVRTLNRIVGSNAIYMICDVQERFRPLIHQMEPVINKCLLVHKACKTLNIPCVITEQYSKVFGKTVSEIAPYDDTAVFQKKQFSMITEEVAEMLQGCGRKQVIVSGIEAHVCVLQSVLDLVEYGFEVHVVADAVSSQRAYDRTIALQTMRATPNVCFTTAESLLFELMRTAEHPQFKSISGLLKEHNHCNFEEHPLSQTTA